MGSHLAAQQRSKRSTGLLDLGVTLLDTANAYGADTDAGFGGTRPSSVKRFELVGGVS